MLVKEPNLFSTYIEARGGIMLSLRSTLLPNEVGDGRGRQSFQFSAWVGISYKTLSDGDGSFQVSTIEGVLLLMSNNTRLIV